MDTRRLLLRAALQKLLDGASDFETIEICLHNMSSIYRVVDSVRHVKRRQGSSEWIEAALDRANFERVGNFTVASHARKRNRVITFTDAAGALEFLFERMQLTNQQRIASTIDYALATNDKQEHKRAARALLGSVLSEDRAALSPEELLLGGVPEALAEFELKRVIRVLPGQGLLARFFPKRTTIYQKA
jgi:hypothetical protein